MTSRLSAPSRRLPRSFKIRIADMLTKRENYAQWKGVQLAIEDIRGRVRLGWAPIYEVRHGGKMLSLNVLELDDALKSTRCRPEYNA